MFIKSDNRHNSNRCDDQKNIILHHSRGMYYFSTKFKRKASDDFILFHASSLVFVIDFQ